ncbi:MAG: helix-hairpin-helix domain-containing protein [Acidobacteria bacterium]|nr:helix-hairpin-helix domain-containing protein [Acidobacteriota bacterium]
MGAACSLCHDLGYITRSNRSFSEWQNLVSDMVARGAPLLPGESSVVLDYLVKNYGSASPKVNVNKASARELAATLELTTTEVEPIIRYRNQEGNLGNWEDLKKVPGLDLTKFERVKDRLTFKDQ